jgi:amino acid transporter
MTAKQIRNIRLVLGTVTALILIVIWILIVWSILHDGPGYKGAEAKVQSFISLLMFTGIGTGAAALFPYEEK